MKKLIEKIKFFRENKKQNTNIQNGVVFKENASILTQGTFGKYYEGYGHSQIQQH